jgi:hypothetical protein
LPFTPQNQGMLGDAIEAPRYVLSSLAASTMTEVS